MDEIHVNLHRIDFPQVPVSPCHISMSLCSALYTAARVAAKRQRVDTDGSYVDRTASSETPVAREHRSDSRRSFLVAKEADLGKRALDQRAKCTPDGAKRAQKGRHCLVWYTLWYNTT